MEKNKTEKVITAVIAAIEETFKTIGVIGVILAVILS